MSATSPLARAILDALSGDQAACDELRALLRVDSPRISDSDAWMPARDAAAYIGVTLDALHKLTAARAIPFEQDGPRCKLWFQRSELDRWRRGGAVRRECRRPA